MLVQNCNINMLENEQEVVAFYRAWEEYENFGIEVPIHAIVDAYVRRDKYYNQRYDNFSPNNLKFNLDKLIMYFVLDENRINDLEEAITQNNFRLFYSLCNVEELHVLGW